MQPEPSSGVAIPYTLKGLILESATQRLSEEATEDGSASMLGNPFTDKLEHATAYETVRSGLADLINSLSLQRAEIPQERTRNGLENRAE